MKFTAQHIFILVGMGLSGFGFYQGVTLSVDQLATGNACPSLGPLPACYLVAVSYGLVSLAWVLRFIIKPAPVSPTSSMVGKVFYVGFLPIFILAVIGSVSEAFGFQVCPHTASGFPKCVISLIVGLIILFSWRRAASKIGAE